MIFLSDYHLWANGYYTVGQAFVIYEWKKALSTSEDWSEQLNFDIAAMH